MGGLDMTLKNNENKIVVYADDPMMEQGKYNTTFWDCMEKALNIVSNKMDKKEKTFN